MSEVTSEQLQAAVRATLIRSAEDQAFRRQALEHPAQAIKEISGLDLPPDSPLRFVEPGSAEGIVLPPFGQPRSPTNPSTPSPAAPSTSSPSSTPNSRI